MKKARFLLVVVILFSASVSFSASASEPSAGVISQTNPDYSWTGTLLLSGRGLCVEEADTCDGINIDVAEEANFSAEISIGPSSSEHLLLDLDLYVYDSSGALVGESAGSSPYESVSFIRGNTDGPYRVRVVSYQATMPNTQYQGHAHFIRKIDCSAPPEGAQSSFSDSPYNPPSLTSKEAGIAGVASDLVAAERANSAVPGKRFRDAVPRLEMAMQGWQQQDSPANPSTNVSYFVSGFADVDMDGKSEVIVRSRGETESFELRRGTDGSIIWSRPLEDAYTWILGDLAGDSRPELVLVTRKYTGGESAWSEYWRFSVLDSLSGADLWTSAVASSVVRSTTVNGSSYYSETDYVTSYRLVPSTTGDGKADFMLTTEDVVPQPGAEATRLTSTTSSMKIFDGANGAQIKDRSLPGTVRWAITNDISGNGVPELVESYNQTPNRTIHSLDLANWEVNWSTNAYSERYLYPLNLDGGSDDLMLWDFGQGEDPFTLTIRLVSGVDGAQKWVSQNTGVTPWPFADANKDGVTDLIDVHTTFGTSVEIPSGNVTYTNYTVATVFDGATGERLWIHKEFAPQNDPSADHVSYFTQLGDSNGDGLLDPGFMRYAYDLVCQRYFGYSASVFSGVDGSKLWDSPTSATAEGLIRPLSGDLNGDGRAEAIHANNVGGLFIPEILSSTDLTPLWKLADFDLSYSYWGSRTAHLLYGSPSQIVFSGQQGERSTVAAYDGAQLLWKL